MPFQCIEPRVLYERDPKLRREDVKILQEWLKKQPHLPEIEEAQVAIVLHSCYFRVEAAKRTIDNYFTIKTLCPDISDPLPKDLLEKTARVAFISFLPKATPDGHSIVFKKFLDARPESFNCVNLIKLVYMVSTLFAHQNGFATKGGIIVFDMKGFCFGHLTRINVPIIRDALYYLQEGSPTRIKQVHVINAIPLADKALALMKPFLKMEILQILHFHSPNSETFYDYVPKEYLPEEYGGHLQSSQVLNDNHVKNMLDNYDFFTWHNTQKVDESKRTEKSNIATSGFGVDGTFKKLEID